MLFLLIKYNDCNLKKQNFKICESIKPSTHGILQ